MKSRRELIFAYGFRNDAAMLSGIDDGSGKELEEID